MAALKPAPWAFSSNCLAFASLPKAPNWRKNPLLAKAGSGLAAAGEGEGAGLAAALVAGWGGGGEAG